VILAKAKEAISHIEPYSKVADPDVFQAVGAKRLMQVAEIEPGAVYAAAESNRCDKVEVSAVHIPKTKKDGLTWYVDCANGNRFIVPRAQAEAALARAKDNKLASANLTESCTATTISDCEASEAQKSANETEIVSACDMAVKAALIGDSSMDWKWDYGLGDGDEVKVARGFKAENAFGANLKHRYLCTYDARKQQITKLIVEGPVGRRQLI